ncbi:jg10226 [Pararge aegeria aegeria]|uniref:Jg10226 protein n=1 Tax=Pararge aegeria aegeria TaxID=348720 RepID=A0A8S4QSN9_9NEOP|nr:jg10226 [Pararge aegeria aegeria]
MAQPGNYGQTLPLSLEKAFNPGKDCYRILIDSKKYSRVLRENEKLQGRTKLHAIDTQTCATTAEKPSQVSLARNDDLNSSIL